MTAILKEVVITSIVSDIEQHAAWLGQISGLKAEKMLRKETRPYLFVLRAGEHKGDYYVTYILEDGSISHRPFTVTETVNGWYYENTGAGGPYKEATIDDVIHLIMHCHKDECVPYIVA